MRHVKPYVALSHRIEPVELPTVRTTVPCCEVYILARCRGLGGCCSSSTAVSIAVAMMPADWGLLRRGAHAVPRAPPPDTGAWLALQASERPRAMFERHRAPGSDDRCQ